MLTKYSWSITSLGKLFLSFFLAQVTKPFRFISEFFVNPLISIKIVKSVLILSLNVTFYFIVQFIRWLKNILIIDPSQKSESFLDQLFLSVLA